MQYIYITNIDLVLTFLTVIILKLSFFLPFWLLLIIVFPVVPCSYSMLHVSGLLKFLHFKHM